MGIHFLYDDGLWGSFISASGENLGVNRFEMWGTKGMIPIEGDKKLTLRESVMETIRFQKENARIYGTFVYTTEKVCPP